MRRYIYAFATLMSSGSGLLLAHCQMPCGIYHDEMVYDQIDQYVETMVKGIAKIKDNKFATPQDRNEGVRWILTKDHLSDDISTLITTYFLQQKIKPGEQDTGKKVESAHKLLFFIVAIKQTVDFKAVSDFAEEWEKFKLMFHIEGYECVMDQKELKALEQKRKEVEAKEKGGTTLNSKPTPASTGDSDKKSKDVKPGV